MPLLFLCLKVNVRKGNEIEQCMSVTDPHYTSLHPYGKGRSVKKRSLQEDCPYVTPIAIIIAQQTSTKRPKMELIEKKKKQTNKQITTITTAKAHFLHQCDSILIFSLIAALILS